MGMISKKWGLAIAICALFACDPQKSQKSEDAGQKVEATDASKAKPDAAKAEPQIKYLEGPSPTDDTVLASWRDYKVTIADFDKSARIGRLFSPEVSLDQEAPEVPKQRMAMPTVHFTMTRALLSRHVVSEGIEEYGIKVTDEDVREALKKDERLKVYGEALGTEKLSRYLEKLGLTEADLLQVGREIVERSKLEEHLISRIDEKQVWQDYQYKNRTVRLAIANAMNVPSSSALSDYVEKNGDKIEKYFEENKKSFRIPRRVEVDMVHLEDGAKPKDDVLDRAARLFARGESAPEIAKKLGLKARESVYLVRQQNPQAFGSAVGETGATKDSPRGSYAWRVKGFHDSRIPEMDRSLRRQVAAEIMRRTMLVPSLEEALEKAQKVFRKLGYDPSDEELARARKKIEDLRLEFQVTPPFPRAPNGAVPGIGLAKELSESAFDLSEKKPTTQPILSRERGFVAHLLEKNEPSRETFDASKDVLIEQFKKDARPTIVDRFVQSRLGPEGSQFNLKPLGIKYGVISK